MIRIEAKELNNQPTYSINENVSKTKKGQHYGHLIRRKRRKNLSSIYERIRKNF